MSEANKELVRRYYAVTSGDLTGIEDIVAENFVDHHFPPNLPPGPEGVKRFFNEVLGAFGNRCIEIDDLIAEGDKVVCIFKLLAVHVSDFAGFAAQNEPICCPAVSHFRIENGKLAEGWELADLFGLFEQLKAAQAVAA